MKTKDFYFDLPPELIAQAPTPNRGDSRLMVLHRQTKTWSHHGVGDLPQLLPQNSLLVFNNSKVRKVRVACEGIGGGAIEVLFVSPWGEQDGSTWKCMVRKSGSKQIGTQIIAPENVLLEVIEREDLSFILKANKVLTESWFDTHGHVPLPPYIARSDTKEDDNRYQTVYADKLGSAAAPTAGLHFTPQLLQDLNSAGHELTFLTLHVGLGTFAPVQVETITDHTMHHEEYEISDTTAFAINQAKKNNHPIIAVGTTSLRTMEAAWVKGTGIKAGRKTTNIFMYPGYIFQTASALFTNFHTPQSTLLMLVSAFAERDFILDAYQEAIRQKYRFFSYGDAMLIL